MICFAYHIKHRKMSFLALAEQARLPDLNSPKTVCKYLGPKHLHTKSMCSKALLASLLLAMGFVSQPQAERCCHIGTVTAEGIHGCRHAAQLCQCDTNSYGKRKGWQEDSGAGRIEGHRTGLKSGVSEQQGWEYVKNQPWG